jgi:aminopeptidase N
MEQFPIREMVPLMMNDFKPSISPVSNKNLTNNEEILDYLSPDIYSKGASLLRLLEYIAGNETFQTAVRDIFSVTDVSNVLNTFYSNFDFNTLLNTTTITAEEFLRSWLEERNYPIVTIDFIPNNKTLIFRQTRYFGSFALDNSALDPNYVWNIYMECDIGGFQNETDYNLTANYVSSRLKFIFQSSTEVIQLSDDEYIWIKCNKDFYSYQVTEYVSYEEDKHALWQRFELLFNEVC